MARTKLAIDKSEFQRIVNNLEAKQSFTNPSELWKAVENTEWARNQSPRPLTASVAYARAKELGITTKTKPGKRGRPEIGSAPKGKRTSRAAKMAGFTKSFEEMRKRFPLSLHNTIASAERGSLRAAIKLNCMECSGFQREEVKHCQCTGCPLFPHRPHQE